MNYLFLAAGLLALASCSGSATEKPAAVAQAGGDSITVEQADSDQYSFHPIVVPTDTTLVFPVPTHAAVLCTAIQDAWRSYLRQHPEVKRQLAFKEDNEEWYVGASLTIGLDGRIRDFTHSTAAPLFAKSCVQALAPTLYASRWRALYQKTRTGPSPMVSKVTAYFSLLPDGTFSVAFTDYDHRGYHFFSCGQRFHAF